MVGIDAHDPNQAGDATEQSSSSSYQNQNFAMENDDERNNENKSCPWAKLVVGAVLLAVIVFAVVDSLTTKRITSGFESFLDWIDENLVAGVFAFMGVYAVATVAFVPGSILTLGIGFVLGKAAGLGPGVALATITVFVGASLGAIASFLLGRYLLRSWVEQALLRKYPSIKACDKVFKQNGFRIFVLLRLSPVVPFNVINYIAGVTCMKLLPYALALIFMLPGTVLYCFIGATAGSLTESENAVSGPVAIASIVVGILLGLGAIYAISYYAKREFDNLVSEEEQQEGEHGGLSADGVPTDEEQPKQQEHFIT